MGWAGGSEVFECLIKELKKRVPEKKDREKIYSKMIDVFEDHDCDTLHECLGVDKAFDTVYKDKHPKDEDDDDY